MTAYSCVNCDSEYNEEQIKDNKLTHIGGVEGDYITCTKCGYFEFRIKITTDKKE